MARPRKSAQERKEERVVIYVTKDDADKIETAAKNVDTTASEIGGKMLLEWAATLDRPRPVRLLGYIPGGKEADVRHLPEGTTVVPPFKLREDCYGLLVSGTSMQCDYGLSIPDGSYAFFCPTNESPHFGAIVHAEFPKNPGVDDGERTCSLKRFLPQADGSAIFEPLNKEGHEAFKKGKGEYRIKGIFMRAWNGEDEVK